MLYVHENNIKNKISSNYNGNGEKIKKFYDNIYMKYRNKLEELNYTTKDINVFNKATELMNEYLIEVEKIEKEVKITSQSKFRSTFIEEISVYLFKNLPLIKDGTFVIFNKNIYAGMKVNNHMHIDIISKDVDFCVGKKVELKVEQEEISTIIPIVCVEAKTY